MKQNKIGGGGNRWKEGSLGSTERKDMSRRRKEGKKQEDCRKERTLSVAIVDLAL